jgi:hypothetical protein
MPEQTNTPAPPAQRTQAEQRPPITASRREETQPCPRCGQPMPALKGGTASICTNCGFKDSCCY